MLNQRLDTLSARPRTSQGRVSTNNPNDSLSKTLDSKRRHGRLHKMGIVNIEEKMSQQHKSSQKMQHNSFIPFEGSSAEQHFEPTVSQSLPSLHIPSISTLPPLAIRSGSFVPERSYSPNISQRPSTVMSTRLSSSSSSRPATALGFGSSTDRKLANDSEQEKQPTLEEIHQLELMMNPNRPRTSSVRVQIKRYISDLETLERNASLTYAHASSHAMKANFTYTGSLDELQETFTREAKSFDSVALFAETRYLEMISFDGADKEPTKFKAALSADLLTKLTSSMERKGRVMDPLIWELCNCIFVDFEKIESRYKHDPSNLMLKELVRAPTYLELAHQLHDRLDELAIETEIVNRGLKMKGLVKKFQTLRLAFQKSDIFIRDACFSLWKGFFRKHQRQCRLATVRALRYRFRQWKFFISQHHQRSRKGEELSDKLDAKIHRLMTLNQNLLQISEQQVDQQHSTGIHALAKQPTIHNLSENMTNHLISNILNTNGSMSTDSDSNAATPIGATPRVPSQHGLTINNTQKPSLRILTNHQHSDNALGSDGSMANRPLSSSDKRVKFFTTGDAPSVSEAGRSHSSQGHLSLTPDSRPDTPELMEINRKQTATQQHIIAAQLLSQARPNAARAILRHRAAMIGGLQHSAGRRRLRIPQQDVGIQANAEDFETVDIQNHRIMLPRTAISNASKALSRNKLDTNVDGDDFDHSNYMVIILSPRDQHEIHVGNITTHPLGSISQKMEELNHTSPRSFQQKQRSQLSLASGLSSNGNSFANLSQSSPERQGAATTLNLSAVANECASVYLSTTLSMDMVMHLISSIYESLFCHYFYDPRATEEVSSILFLARDVIYRRYHYDRALGKTIFKEFVRGCLEYVGLSKRIEVFCKLSGLISSDIEDLETGTSLTALTDEAASINKIRLTADSVKNMHLPDKLHFFILMISLWSNNIPLVAVNLLLTSMVDREIVLHHLPELFPSLEKQNKVYDMLVTTVIDLPCYHADTLRNNHFAEADKIDLDILCEIFLRYEQSERSAKAELHTLLADSRDDHFDSDRDDA